SLLKATRWFCIIGLILLLPNTSIAERATQSPTCSASQTPYQTTPRQRMPPLETTSTPQTQPCTLCLCHQQLLRYAGYLLQVVVVIIVTLVFLHLASWIFGCFLKEKDLTKDEIKKTLLQQNEIKNEIKNEQKLLYTMTPLTKAINNSKAMPTEVEGHHLGTKLYEAVMDCRKYCYRKIPLGRKEQILQLITLGGYLAYTKNKENISNKLYALRDIYNEHVNKKMNVKVRVTSQQDDIEIKWGR
ncbi:MAG: hypothetical protein ACPGC9_01670, partial [Cytophagales bacterium]